MKVEKITGYVGAEIAGVDLAWCSDADVYAEIRAALNEHGVIFFRDQILDLDQFAAFGERFGELFINNGPTIAAHGGNPKVEIVSKEAHEVTNIGDEWHSDQAHRVNPCMGTILYGQEIPPYGGDTCFISTAAAYEHLPDDLKRAVEGLSAVQSNQFMIQSVIDKTGDPDKRFRPTLGDDRASKVAVHPVVKIHPETGRKSLYINPAMTYSFEGQTREESLPLLRQLFDHCLRPEYGCRFKWRQHSIAFWDNRQTWHYAVNDYHGFRRIMHRLIVRTDVDRGGLPMGRAAILTT